jgi:recombination protein RecA
MSQALRKLTASIGNTGTAVIFINQLREKVGIVFGNPEVTPGGRALKFYSSVRLDVRRVETLKSGNSAIGTHVKVKVVKNKVAPPFRSAEFDILFDSGISREGNLIDLGVESGVIKKSGAFFSYGDVRLGQGREAVRTFLAAHPETADAVESDVRAAASANASFIDTE